MAKQYYDLDQLHFEEKPSNSRFKDLEGKTFACLKVLGFAGKKNKSSLWYCFCKCGKITKTRSDLLISGKAKSCGCLSSESAKDCPKIHGGFGTVEYEAYCGMKRRCENPRHKGYKYYGGRGISVNLTFQEFLNEVGKRPSPEFSIDRIDNNGNYEQGNLRWAKREVQCRNKRSNRLVQALGQKKIAVDWAKELNIPARTISSRINRGGWCDLHSLTLPIHSRRPKNCPKCNKLRNPISDITKV